MSGWGKAGVRLSDAEAAARRRARMAARHRNDAARARSDAIARRLYDHGMLCPSRISLFLDAAGQFGPEVDARLGVEEPTVDLWEAGRLYPTWEQVLALAELVGCWPRQLMLTPTSIRFEDTSMRFHMRRRVPGEEPVERFTPKAIRDRIGEV